MKSKEDVGKENHSHIMNNSEIMIIIIMNNDGGSSKYGFTFTLYRTSEYGPLEDMTKMMLVIDL